MAQNTSLSALAHRTVRLSLAACVAIPIVAAATAATAAAGIDGDGLRIAGVAIRLHGIDAFEIDQRCGEHADAWPCGRASAEALAALVAGRDVACRVITGDRYGRAVARCRAGGIDLGEAIVRAGLALAYTRYSNRYTSAESAARQSRAGAWGGPGAATFTPPEIWRRWRRSH